MLCACGGGGDKPATHVAATPTTVSVAASTDDAAPVAAVSLSVVNPPDDNLFAGDSATQNGIASVTFAGVSRTLATFTIDFKPPASLGAGTYDDTLTIGVCFDANCAHPVDGSPINVSVHYTVTQGTNTGGGDGGQQSSLPHLPLIANDIAWDPAGRRLYLSLPNANGPQGNVIMAIDPVTGQTLATQYAGSEPNVLALSADGHYLYAGIDGASSVQRFVLPALTPDLSYSLGTNGFLGPYVALDLQVSPTSPQTTAVSAGTTDFSPQAQRGVAIYDGATQRPDIAPGWSGGFALYDSLQWDPNGAALYASNSEVTSFDFYTLSVDASGVQQTQDFENTFSQFFRRIHYESGTHLVYSEDGRVIVPSTGARAGVFQASGPLVTNAAQNRAFFLQCDGAGHCTLDRFDLTHFTPIGSTDLGTVSQSPNRLVQWDTAGFAFNTGGGPVYLINGGGSTTGSPAGTPTTTIASDFVALPANDVVWDATHARLYVSVPSTAGAGGNSVAAIDPATGTITSTAFVGSEPAVLAISDDAQFLYVGLNGSNQVQRLKLPSLAPDIAYSLGSDQFTAAYYALDIQVAPGAPHTVAISRGDESSSPAALGGVVIYDDATPRPTHAPGFGPGGGGGVLYDSLQWGHDASRIFAANREDTGFDFYTLDVDGSGVTLDQDYGYVFPGFGGNIHFDRGTGIIYGDDGHTADPTTGQPVGVFNASGAMVPDSSIDRAFFLGQPPGASDFVLTSFDLGHYTPVAQAHVAGVSGFPKRLVRWGTDGLAFCTASGVYILHGAIVGNGPLAVQKSLERALPQRTWTGSGVPMRHEYLWSAPAR